MATSEITQAASHEKFASFPNTPYPDLAIDPSKQIRLVTIHRGKKNEDIKCTLSSHILDLDQSGNVAPVKFWDILPREYDPSPYLNMWRPEVSKEYFALSYCWGSFADHCYIRLNGISRFSVSRNLWCALRRLRSKAKRGSAPRRYWIDQLCINQHDIAERNHQVAIMAEIFHQAFKVMVWLFDAPDELRIRLLDQHDRLRLFKTLFECEKRAEQCWWNRAWVTQEFVVARYSPVILFGRNEMNWDKVMPKPSEHELWRQVRNSALYESCHALTGARLALFKLSAFEMNDFGLTLVSTTSLDPHDKVYSLLGLVRGLNTAIHPDYAKDLSALFAETTCAAITSSGHLGILELIVLQDASRADLELPTWTVNFAYTAPAPVNPPSHWVRILNENWKSAMTRPWSHNEGSGTAQASMSVRDNLRSLKVRGLAFDRILMTFPLEFDSQNPKELQDRIDRHDWPSRDEWLSALASSVEPGFWDFLLPLFQLGHPFTRLMSTSPGSGLRSEVLEDQFHESIRHRAAGLAIKIWQVHHLVSYWEKYHQINRTSQVEDRIEDKVFEHAAQCEFVSGGSTLFVTCAGFIGIGPKRTEEGHEIALLYGCSSPVLLSSSQYPTRQFKGLVHVVGISNGELYPNHPEIRLSEEDFILT